MAEYEHIRVDPVSSALGAEISHLDLRKKLSQECLQELKKAWNQHLVLFFRDQNLALAEMMRFAGEMGTPSPYPYVEGLKDFPNIVPILKLPEEKNNFGGVWHLDTAYLPTPALGAVLMAKEIPAAGGDTIFANMQLAYDNLEEKLQEKLSKLSVFNTSSKDAVSKSRTNRINKNRNITETAEHPAVRLHPETGKRSIFISPAHAIKFSGMSEEESKTLLDLVFQHQTKDEFCYRFKWKEGSIALWDNRATLHYPLNDYQGQKRLLYRISLKGNKPIAG